MMKKCFAMLLALCMALAVMPAMAEDDMTGTWYMVMAGVTAGSIELNADGTVALTAYGAETEHREGTWTADGETVTVTVDGQDLPLNYDGTNLVFGEAAMRLFGGDTAANMDLSMLESLFTVSREPGRFTTEELNAYSENGTLPEGVTEEEMQAFQMQMLMTTFSLMGGVNLGEAETEASAELTVVEENFYVRDSYDGQEGMYLAKVQNDNEIPVSLSNGTLTVLDAEGKEIGTSEFMYQTGSRYLEPGEATYLSIAADLSAGTEAASYKTTVEASSYTWSKDEECPVDAAELRMGDEYSSYAAATVTNSTEQPLGDLQMSMVLRDESGNLLEIVGASLYGAELAPGSTITLLGSIDSRTIAYCEANNLTLAEPEVSAYRNVE